VRKKTSNLIFFWIFSFQEDYHDLPLVIQDSPNLQTSLAYMFTVHEQLIGDNQYRCSSCSNRLCDADKVD